METIAEGDAGFAVIEHYAANEAVASDLFKFTKPTQISRIHCSSRFDFPAADGTGFLLDNNICLDAVFVSKCLTSAPTGQI